MLHSASQKKRNKAGDYSRPFGTYRHSSPFERLASSGISHDIKVHLFWRRYTGPFHALPEGVSSIGPDFP